MSKHVRILSNIMMHIRGLVHYWSLSYHLGESCISMSTSPRHLQFNTPSTGLRIYSPCKLPQHSWWQLLPPTSQPHYFLSPYNSSRRVFRFHFPLMAASLQPIITFPWLTAITPTSSLCVHPSPTSFFSIELP